MTRLQSQRLDRRIRIERPVAATGFGRAGKSTWVLVVEVWANVQDALPSRAEKLADGINMLARPARLRIRYRPGISADMRVLIGRTVDGEWVTDRTMQIVAGPAELGKQETLEFMVEEYSTSGVAK